MRAFMRFLRRLGPNRAGSVAVVVGLALPALVLAGGAAVEYANLASRKAQLQKAADAAALAAAQKLRLSNTTDGVVDSTVRDLVDSMTGPRKDGSMTVQSAVAGDRAGVDVQLRETVRSLLGKLMSLPTMDIAVRSTARLMGSAKLCLLTLEPTKDRALNLDKDSSVTAVDCAIYSNSKNKAGLNAEGGAVASAALICSVGGVKNKGVLSPSPTTDCPAITDPLLSIPKPSVPACKSSLLKISSSTTLWPGTYCGGLSVTGTATVTLMPGIYVIHDGPLIVSNTATLSGDNVGLYFSGDAGGLRFDPDTTVSLTAPKSGSMAGLLMFEDRSVGSPVPPPPGPKGSPPPPPYGSQPMREYRITSNNAPTLLGTIYLPAGRLVIDASRPVADRSAFTVIVARQLELNSGPNLYLNTNYAATDIPVPDGVGPKSGNVAIVR